MLMDESFLQWQTSNKHESHIYFKKSVRLTLRLKIVYVKMNTFSLNLLTSFGFKTTGFKP